MIIGAAAIPPATAMAANGVEKITASKGDKEGIMVRSGITQDQALPSGCKPFAAL